MWPPPTDGDLPRLEGYHARRMVGARAVKAYVCPDCGNRLPPGVGHVVAWPEDRPDERRHWHLHCWRHAARRGYA